MDEPGTHAFSATPEQAADFLDGWSLATQRVNVEVSRTHVRVTASDGRLLADWDAAGLACDALQTGVLHVTHQSARHETLVVSDPSLELRILALRPTVEASIPGGERKLRYALACLAILLGLGAGIYATIPALSRLVALRIPLAKERALGAQLELVLDRSTCSEPPAQPPLEALVQRLGGGRFQVRIMKDPMPNAFALPGGIILVTDRLLRDAESPDEVAGVLAHEIEHITQRHVLAGMVRDTILTALWSITVGDYAGLLVLDPSTAYRIANLEFSREDEAAADAGAIARLRTAHIDCAGLATFFARMNERYGGALPKWLSTHPPNRERIEAFRKARGNEPTKPALDGAAFALLRRGCG